MINSFNYLPDELIHTLALSFPLREISYFCRSNQRFNNLICNDEYFWRQKFIKDYGDVDWTGSWKNLYMDYLNVWIFGGNNLGLLGLGSDLRAMIILIDISLHKYPILKLNI